MLVSLMASACASYGSHLIATPTPPGGREISLAADALVIDRGLGPQVLPNPEVGVRWGITDGLDLGGRANVGGLEANARWRVIESGSVDVAVVPGLGFGFVPVTNSDAGVFNANALGSVLTGVKVGPRTQWVSGARGALTYAFPATAFRGDNSGAKMIYSIGGVMGLRLPIGDTTYLFPDLNVLAPFDGERHTWYFPTVQGGVALQFE